MRLIRGLAKQLNATLTVKSDNGVCVELVFPEKNNSSFITDDN